MQKRNESLLKSASFGCIIDEKSMAKKGLKSVGVSGSIVDRLARLITVKQEYIRC